MATQAKADRQAAAKKAAVTRQRNTQKTRSQQAGQKAASTRQKNQAAGTLDQARSKAKGAVTGLGGAGKLAGTAAIQAGKSIATRAKSATGR